MNLTVNGNAVITEATTLADFFTSKHIETAYIIVELNRDVLAKTIDYTHVVLNEGDDINILHIVGGG